MVSRPPQRNLGSGENWGRWVEENLTALQQDTTQQLQSIQRSISNINANNRVTPFSRVYSNYTTDWNAKANTTKPICSVTVPWEIGKTSCTVLIIFKGFYSSARATPIPQSNISYFVPTINSVNYTGNLATMILGAMTTYNVIGIGSAMIDTVGDFTVDASVVTPTSDVPLAGSGNYMELHVLAAFS